MAALKQLAVPTVKVRRDGHVRELAARALVPGDIVLLEAGNLVPADGRIRESANLRIQEAALTGESEPVDKVTSALDLADLPLGDRRNMAYMGTVVTYGRGQIVVTDTGMRTQLGAIVALLQTMAQEPTPLQRRLDQLGRTLASVALAIVAVIFAIGLLRGEDLKLMFLTAVSMAVAAVPEGLPAVVTIALALGAQRMLARRALIRKLAAVETLGSVTVICSDKTGTLTENRMTVTLFDVGGQRFSMAELLPAGGDLANASGQPPLLVQHASLALLLVGGALCNDALVEPGGTEENGERIVGDPTEGALVVAAARLGLMKAELEAVFPRVAEVPFDSARKRMTTVHVVPAGAPASSGLLRMLWDGVLGRDSKHHYIAFSKGAVDSLLDVCSAVWHNGSSVPLAGAARDQIAAANDQLAMGGMRVLGVAIRPLDALPTPAEPDLVEHDLIFVGMLGMIDRKFIKYLMTTNAGKLWVMLLAPLLGMPLPLLPLQILWVNLVTDGLPALALSAEPAEQNTMRRPPYPPNEHIFAGGLGRHILWVGLLMGLIVVGVGYGYWYAGQTQWQTRVFLTITLAQVAHVLAIRSERDSLFHIGLWSNKLLLGAVALTFVLQLVLIYVPFFQALFETVALSLYDLAIGLALSSLIFWAVELEKWLTRRRTASASGTRPASAKA